MGRYMALYRCRLCGAVISNGRQEDVPDDMVLEMLGQFIRNQLVPWAAQQKSPMYTAHRCDDGNIGLASFAGFRKIE